MQKIREIKKTLVEDIKNDLMFPISKLLKNLI